LPESDSGKYTLIILSYIQRFRRPIYASASVLYPLCISGPVSKQRNLISRMSTSRNVIQTPYRSPSAPHQLHCNSSATPFGPTSQCSEASPVAASGLRSVFSSGPAAGLRVDNGNSRRLRGGGRAEPRRRQRGKLAGRRRLLQLGRRLGLGLQGLVSKGFRWWFESTYVEALGGQRRQ
jgi:hypothetical protein